MRGDVGEAVVVASLHIAPADDGWRSRALARVVDGADAIWLDARPPDEADQAATARIFETRGVVPAGASLVDAIGEPAAATLQAAALARGFDAAPLADMKPWRAYLTLTVRQMIADGYAPGAGLDAALRAEAAARGRALRFFGGVEGQLDVFAGLAPDAAAALARWRIDSLAREGALDDVVAAWTSGDLAAIDAALNAPMREAAPAAFDAIVMSRNEMWVTRIADVADDAIRALVVVPSEHLVGPGSAIDILRAEGFEVERLDAPPTTDDKAKRKKKKRKK
ncbi:MAG: TraB/GumN family protein [Parvularculaceae bacterium]